VVGRTQASETAHESNVLRRLRRLEPRASKMVMVVGNPDGWKRAVVVFSQARCRAERWWSR
jgi:hypothetical protein